MPTLWSSSCTLLSFSTQVRAGFPPKLLDGSDDAMASSMLAAGETLIASGPVATTQAKSNKKVKVPSSNGGAKGGDASASRGGARNSTAASRSCGGGGGGGGIATLSNPRGRPSSSSSSSSASGTKRRRPKAINLESKEDVGSSMVSALSGGGGGGRKAKFLRAATRSAVDKQYEVASGNDRLRAALTGEVRIADAAHARSLGDGAATEMVVSYKKDRSWVEETVTAVPVVALQGILNVILMEHAGEEGREHLKPHNLAQTSPRVFWSIYRHFGRDYEAALVQLLPGVDLGFLNNRAKRLSAKAEENLRQERMLRGEADDGAAAGGAVGGAAGGRAGSGASSGGDAADPGPPRENLRGRAAACRALETGRELVQQALQTLPSSSSSSSSSSAAAVASSAAAVAAASDGADHAGEAENGGDAGGGGAAEDEGGKMSQEERERQALVSEAMKRIVGNDEAIVSSLAHLGVTSPRDLTKLRVEPLFEYVQGQSMQIDRAQIKQWRAEAWTLLAEYPWMCAWTSPQASWKA